MSNRMATVNLEITQREHKHACISEKIAAQGIVLLENKGALPFDESVRTIALFGGGARRTVKGGTGSGDVNTRGVVSVELGLENAGYSVVTKHWLDEYDAVMDTARNAYNAHIQSLAQDGVQVALLTLMGKPFRLPGFRALTQDEPGKYPADAAVYVLARNSGEGADRKPEAGDYYLSEQEIQDITLLSQSYGRFVLVLNVGGVVDLKPIRHLPGLGAVLLAGQGGSCCGEAVAEIVSGADSPSGKLTTTWAKQYSDYPYAEEFAGMNGQIYDAYYSEGVYVGYRYFDSFGVEPAYSFGFGLSYTDFSLEVWQAKLDKDTVSLEVWVRNVGIQYSGREVVQVYASPPAGRLHKPHQALAAFGKTKRLAPGESQTLTLRIPLTRLASYDEAAAAWVLEKGEYLLRVGNSSRNTRIAAVCVLPQDVITERCRNLFRGEKQDMLQAQHYRLSASEQEAYRAAFRLTASPQCFTPVEHTYSDAPAAVPVVDHPVTFADVMAGKADVDALVSGLTVEELALLCVGSARINMKDFSVIGNASSQLPGAAGETTAALREGHGIPPALMADGPAGIRVNPKVYERPDGLYINNPAEDPILSLVLPLELQTADMEGTTTKYQYCTALPVATLLAQTWDLELLELAGDIMGVEMELLGVDLWLAPGMNLHRNPLCGRNFEYYAEDPLLSGLCAAAVTHGVQRHPGKGTCIKHLAANNQETKRSANNSHVSERALRELYLKGFEICVQEARPLTAMTSMNLINGVHAANDRDMLTAALREEWGFTGMVMTDWATTSQLGEDDTKYACSSSEGCIRAGNDLIMPGSQGDIDRILAAVEDGILSLGELQACAGNVLRMLVKVSVNH